MNVTHKISFNFDMIAKKQCLKIKESKLKPQTFISDVEVVTIMLFSKPDEGRPFELCLTTDILDLVY